MSAALCLDPSLEEWRSRVCGGRASGGVAGGQRHAVILPRFTTAPLTGAGPAGLSAALILGRAGRRTLLFDSGEKRNEARRAGGGWRQWERFWGACYCRRRPAPSGAPPLHLCSLTHLQPDTACHSGRGRLQARRIPGRRTAAGARSLCTWQQHRSRACSALAGAPRARPRAKPPFPFLPSRSLQVAAYPTVVLKRDLAVCNVHVKAKESERVCKEGEAPDCCCSGGWVGGRAGGWVDG